MISDPPDALQSQSKGRGRGRTTSNNKMRIFSALTLAFVLSFCSFTCVDGFQPLASAAALQTTCIVRRAIPPSFAGPTASPIGSFVNIQSKRRRSCGATTNTRLRASALSSLSNLLPITPSNPLISAADDWGNASAILASATIAQILGKSTSIGRLLGPPVTAMALTFLLATIGIMPPGGSTGTTALQIMTLNLATPLLLLGADIKSARKSCGPLLVSFILAALATMIASCVALTLGPTRSMLINALGVDGLKVAAALMAKNIGGGINYFAVAAALGMEANAVAAGICVDNVFALLYFPVTSAMGAGRPDVVPPGSADDNETDSNEADSISDGVTVERVSTLLSLSTLAAWMGRMIGGKPNALPVSTLLTVLGTTLVPNRWVEPLRPTGEILGTALLYVFFATAGAGGLAIADSVKAAFVPIGCFLTILYGVHGSMLAAARSLVLWKRRRNKDSDRKDQDAGDEGIVAPQRLLVASSAAIGGPATAAALAKANAWSSLVTPSLLVGNLGYAIATFAAIAFYRAMI